MIIHNRALHARLKEERKVLVTYYLFLIIIELLFSSYKCFSYQEWAIKENIYMPILCDVNFKLTNERLLIIDMIIKNIYF